MNIPSSVTTIDENPFLGCYNLSELTVEGDNFYVKNDCLISKNGLLITGLNKEYIEIPNSVTKIGSYAFQYCSSLTSVVLPNSVTSIGILAFQDCSSLTSIVLPNSVTSIGFQAFNRCTSLTSIDLPNSVTSIGILTFGHCRSLTSIVLPNSVTSIGERAFECCSSLTSIVLPNSLTSIGRYTFNSCSSLSSIVLPNSVTSIGNYAFNSCWSLATMNIPSSVTTIGDNPFQACANLSDLTVEGGNFYVNNDCLISKDGLLITGLNKEYIEIPNSVTSIGDCAFNSCRSLTLIVLPNSVTSIGYKAFSNCTSLKEITSLNTTPPSIYDDTFTGVSKTECVVKVPDEAVDAYNSADYWKEFLNIVAIEDTPTGISGMETVEAKAKKYNQQGVLVPDGYKGIVIRNGKKILVKFLI